MVATRTLPANALGFVTSLCCLDTPVPRGATVPLTRGASLLESLPHEILGEVVSHLDCHSIRSLLEATPSLKKISLTVSEKTEEGTEFFTVSGVARCSVSDFIEKKLGGSYLIKLWEYNFRQTEVFGHYYNLGEEGEQATIHGRALTDCLDKTTFLHVQGANFPGISYSGMHSKCLHLGANGSRVLVADNFRLSYITGQHYAIEEDELLPAETPDDATSPTAPIYRHDPIPSFSEQLYPFLERAGMSLRKMDLQISNGIVSGINSDFLEELTLHIYDTGRVPLVQDIQAPNMTSFRIFYAGRMPLLKHIGSEVPPNDNVKRYFELTETSSAVYASGQHGYLVDNFSRRSDYAEMNDHFIFDYTDLRISGAPEFILARLLQGPLLQSVNWFKTIQFEDPELGIPDWQQQNCPGIMAYSIFVSVPNFTLPYVKMPRLTHLDIVTTAVGLNLHEAVGSSDLLTWVSVTCYLPRNEVGGDGHIMLGIRDIDFLDNCPNLSTLELIGCVFGPGNCFLRGDVWPSPTLDHSALGTVKLELVRTKEEAKEHLRFTLLEGIDIGNRGWPLQLSLAQVPLKDRTRMWKSVRISSPFDDSTSRRLDLETTEFDKVDTFFKPLELAGR